MPPMSDGMSGKGGSVVGNADHQSTAIFHHIVDPIRNGSVESISEAQGWTSLALLGGSHFTQPDGSAHDRGSYE